MKCKLYFTCFLFIFANGNKITSDYPIQNKVTGKFWQITDIHMDLDYSETGDPANMCHKSSNDSQNSTGHFGNYLCESPYALFRSTLYAMQNIEPNPDFILWTGDNAPHTPNVTLPIIFKTIANISEVMKSLFGSNMRIFPVLGNHDTHPRNNYPASLESFYNDYLDKGNWKSLIPEDSHKDFKTGGYYKVQINTDLDIIVLNTNLYFRKNILGERLKDPGSQFKWLKIVLGETKRLNRKVIVTGHVPPGYWERLPNVSFFNDSYNDEYIDILNEYGEQIIGHVYGHEHTDSFKLFGPSHDDFVSVGFLAPSVSPWHPSFQSAGTTINPSIRLYMFSPSSITDYIQYHINLTEANSLEMDNDQECRDASRRLWKEYYQATKAFGISSTNVKGLTEAFNKMFKNDTYFQAYYLRNSAGIDNGYCNKTCKRFHLCAITNLKIKSLKDCLNSSYGASESFLNVHRFSYDIHKVEMSSIAFITIFSATGFVVFILAFVIHQRYHNSNRTFSEKTFVTSILDGYRSVSTKSD